MQIKDIMNITHRLLATLMAQLVEHGNDISEVRVQMLFTSEFSLSFHFAYNCYDKIKQRSTNYISFDAIL